MAMKVAEFTFRVFTDQLGVIELPVSAVLRVRNDSNMIGMELDHEELAAIGELQREGLIVHSARLYCGDQELSRYDIEAMT